MARDFTKFPDDENGDVLWDMANDGDNLAVPREIDFSVVFPTEDSALKFAVHLLRNDQKTSFSSYETDGGVSWQVQAHPTMEPTYENISGYEKQLGEDAKQYGGRNDGWGSMQQE